MKATSNKKIERSVGSTETERHLIRLGNRTFLNLWSYGNLYINKMVAGQGKELCDLLVVCGDHVIIFSDKSIQWPSADVEVAWGRWYKRAIRKSVDQINGAARWVKEHPDRIFLDKACTQKFPIALPSLERMRLHGVVVARGAGEACKEHYDGGTGSLLVHGAPADYSSSPVGGFLPFSVGDINPDGMFVHVLDDGSLDIVMAELDTISDLADYLSKKEQFIRNGHLIATHGEEDLVAYFQTHMISDYEHGFSRLDHTPLQPKDALVIEGTFEGLQAHPQYVAKQKADKISYLWDQLIEQFTNNMLDGATLVAEGEDFDLSTHEIGVRHMALEPRFRRRNLGSGIADLLKKSAGRDRSVRAFVMAPGTPGHETGFFFLTLIEPDGLRGGHEHYRHVRRTFLETYAFSFLEKYPHLERIIGIGTESLPKGGGKRPKTSEDLIYAERPEWTDRFVADLRERQQHLDVMKEGQYSEYGISGQEYPEAPKMPPKQPEKQSSGLNRKQRRAKAAKKRRRRNRER